MNKTYGRAVSDSVPNADGEHVVTVEVTDQNAIRLRTLADIFDLVPEDRIDAFLLDLGNMMKAHKQLMSAVGCLAQTPCKLDLSDGMLWKDDGRNDIRLNMSRPDRPAQLTAIARTKSKQ